MDKVTKQSFISAIQAVFSSIASKEVSNYKLWPYVVGVSCGLNKRLVVDPQYKSRPIVSLFTFSGWSGDTEYEKEGGWYNNAIVELIDMANEVNAFDLDKVNDICYQVWSCRQALVYPAALATSSVGSKDAASNAIVCSMPITQKVFESLNEKENQSVVVFSTRLSAIIEKLVELYKQEQAKVAAAASS